MLDNVEVFCQSTIKISCDLVLYFDPFKIENESHDADIIFITHDHFDHFDINSILKIKKDDTFIVVPSTLESDVKSYFERDKILVVEPNNSYLVKNISFKTVRAYNINKDFHPKNKNWVGYLVSINNINYYIMGDTDDTLDARSVSADVLFIPIGGVYTMNYMEAVDFTNYVKPKVAVPIHYGDIVGNKEDAINFISNLNSEIEGKILKK
ncbi:MAG: MBL fold metallo-hydrolase [Bacilli bacterium]|nr:MBL fold metallo-hydrolase [Bacilli bacterium]